MSMKVERASATTTYKNDHCALTIPKSKDWSPSFISFVGKYEAASVSVSRFDAVRVLKKMKKIS